MKKETDKGRIMYLGMRAGVTGFFFKYVLINKDNSIGEEWRFQKKLFLKGGVGAIYECTLVGDSIRYNKKIVPTYFIKKKEGLSIATSIQYEEVGKGRILNDQAEVEKRNSTKQDSKVDIEIAALRRAYKDLKPTQRARFVGDLVYKITR